MKYHKGLSLVIYDIAMVSYANRVSQSCDVDDVQQNRNSYLFDQQQQYI